LQLRIIRIYQVDAAELGMDWIKPRNSQNISTV